MDEQKIKDYINLYKKGGSSSIEPDRNGHLEYYRDKCTDAYIDSGSETDLLEFFKKLYATQNLRFVDGGLPGAKDDISKNVKDAKDFIKSLHNAKAASIEKIWDSAKENAIYKAFTMGGASVSEILMFSNPSDFIMVNQKTINAYKFIDLPNFVNLGTNLSGKEYADFCEKGKQLITKLNKLGLNCSDFYELDAFAIFLNDQINKDGLNITLSFIQCNKWHKFVKGNSDDKILRKNGAIAYGFYKNLIRSIKEKNVSFNFVKNGRSNWQHGRAISYIYSQFREKEHENSNIRIAVIVDQTNNGDNRGSLTVSIGIHENIDKGMINETEKFGKAFDLPLSGNLFYFLNNDPSDKSGIQKTLDDKKYGDITIGHRYYGGEFTSDELQEKVLMTFQELVPIYENIFGITNGQILGKAEEVKKSHLLKALVDDMLLSYNTIFYGVPGCGKSYKVNKMLHDAGYKDEDIFRVTFHPEYSNSEFVGQILPKAVEGAPVFSFVPGPFTRALKFAVSNPDIDVPLVIEEINRGNASSIFGDIFQLLDRENGVSQYPIKNADIAKEVYGDENKPIVIPNNLFLIGTMNTSDQNVFPLDTAFKRRWNMLYVENKEAEYGKLSVPGLLKEGNPITWNDFLSVMNNYIQKALSNTINSSDKEIGAYFVKEEDLLSESDDKDRAKKKSLLFASKVFQYLYSDVFAINRSVYFKADIHSINDIFGKFRDNENVNLEDLLNIEKHE